MVFSGQNDFLFKKEKNFNEKEGLKVFPYFFIHLAQKQPEQAKSFLTQAKTLIEEMGYHMMFGEIRFP